VFVVVSCYVCMLVIGAVMYGSRPPAFCDCPCLETMSGDPSLFEKYLQLKNNARTEKARQASLLSKQKRKLEAPPSISSFGEGPQASAGEASELKQQVTSRWFTLQGLRHRTDDVKNRGRGRRRAIWSLLCAMAQSLASFFETESCVAHAVSVNVVDDTNMRFATSLGEPGEVITVMQNLQSAYLQYDSGCFKAFQIHQPLLHVEKPDTRHMFKKFVSWLFISVTGTGEHLRRLGIRADILQSARLVATIVVQDSLRANKKLFRWIKFAVQTQPRTSMTHHVALEIPCFIHQLSLVRKPLALTCHGYWTAIVRLAHLFEGSGFRRDFGSHLISVIRSSFDYVPLAVAPRNFQRWQEERSKSLSLFSDGYCQQKGSVSKRLKLLVKLCVWDNGDPQSEAILFWDVGSKYTYEIALDQLLTYYTALFVTGFPVPLLYRWKHAERAQDFVDVWTLPNPKQSSVNLK
jgi:hypothetical protein